METVIVSERKLPQNWASNHNWTDHPHRAERFRKREEDTEKTWERRGGGGGGAQGGRQPEK